MMQSSPFFVVLWFSKCICSYLFLYLIVHAFFCCICNNESSICFFVCCNRLVTLTNIPTSLILLQVPPHLFAVFKKHKDLFAAEVDEACSNFGNVVKAIQTKRMAALLMDVHGASTDDGNFTIPCPMASAQTSDAGASQHVPEKEPTADDVSASQHLPAKDSIDQVVLETVVEIGTVQPSVVASPSREEHLSTSEHAPTNIVQPSTVINPALDEQHQTNDGEPSLVDSPEIPDSPLAMVSPSKLSRKIPEGFWDDTPSMELFEEGSEDCIFFANIPDSPSRLAAMLQSPAAATSADSTGCASPLNTDHTPVNTVDAGQSLAQDGNCFRNKYLLL